MESGILVVDVNSDPRNVARAVGGVCILSNVRASGTTIGSLRERTLALWWASSFSPKTKWWVQDPGTCAGLRAAGLQGACAWGPGPDSIAHLILPEEETLLRYSAAPHELQLLDIPYIMHIPSPFYIPFLVYSDF